MHGGQIEGAIYVYGDDTPRPDIELDAGYSYDDLCLSVSEARELSNELLRAVLIIGSPSVTA